MVKCVMCGREIWESAPYVTDGKIAVCDKCAAANSLMRVVTRLENRGYDANIKSVYVRPIVVEAGLVNQTENADSQVKTNLPPTVDAVPFAPIKERVSAIYEQCREEWEKSHNKKAVSDLFDKLAKAVSVETGFSIPELGLPYPVYVRSDGTIADESEIADDLENLSQEDFYSKYADDPAALEAFHNMNGEPAEFLKV